jgi:hypothetical protein
MQVFMQVGVQVFTQYSCHFVGFVRCTCHRITYNYVGYSFEVEMEMLI